MNLFGRLFAAIVLLSMASGVMADPLVSLVWHDISTNPGSNPLTIRPATLKRQLEFIRKQGYTPVSLKELIRAHAGHGHLPRKPILLTFDDGLKSYRDIVVPMLQRYHYPSVLSVVPGWVDGRDVPPGYRGKLLSWDDLRALIRSPLVEIASHTYDLHHDIRMNRQGDRDAAAITREYRGLFYWRYETEDEFSKRVYRDLVRSRQRLQQELGVNTTVLTWPYGKYDAVSEAAARVAGFRVFLTLDPRPTPAADWPRIGRIMVGRGLAMSDMARRLRYGAPHAPYRFGEFRLDDFAGTWPPTQEYLLRKWVAHVRALHVNTVIVSAFTRDDTKAFFPNSRVPVAADVLSRVLRQIWTRTPVRNLFVRIDRVPADADDQMWRDFARLNHFTGLILPARLSAKERAAIVRLVRPYRSGLKVAVAERNAADGGLTDFILQRRRNSSVRRARGVRRAKAHAALLLAAVTVGSRNKTGISQLAHLRAVGTQNYGIAMKVDVSPSTIAALANVLRISSSGGHGG